MDCFSGINILAGVIAGVPIRVSHSHNTNSANASKENPSLAIKVYRNLMRVLINNFSTDKLGCSSEANLFLYGNKYAKESKFIYNGIELDKFRNNSDLTIEDVNIKKDRINFITIGRICEQKNSIFIVEVFNELSKIQNNIHLYWIGEGPLKEDIRNKIETYKLNEKIDLLGRRDDIPNFLSNMDFMIFPSKWEGLGIVLIESQASSVPCFISDKISQEADLGLCTQISLDCTAKEWAEKINEFINNKTYNNFLDIDKLNQFDIKNTVKQIEEVYSK